MTYPFWPFQPPTPEQEAEMRAAHDRRNMESEAFQHDFQTMFEEMPLDHLRTLKTMLSTTCGDQHTSTYFEGMVTAYLKSRFNICMTHGVNHDEQLATPVAPPVEPQQQVQDVPIPGIDELLSVNDPKSTGPLSEQEVDLMETYHLDDLRDEDTNEILGFICTGINGAKGSCGHVYISIEDRMLRDPEHCSGCFVKMATG